MASTATRYDSDCVLMLHLDGADASTTFPDFSYYNRNVTAYLTTEIDTDQSVFGGASSLHSASGLQVPDDAALALGSSDFTIDFRVRFNPLPASGTNYILTQHNLAGDLGWLFFMNNVSGTYTLRFRYSVNGTSYETDKIFSVTPSADTWYHIALVRNGNDLKCFWDGNQAGSTADLTGVTINKSENISYIASNLQGWLDEFRWVIGTAVWTSAFTIPSTAYIDANEDSVLSYFKIPLLGAG